MKKRLEAIIIFDIDILRHLSKIFQFGGQTVIFEINTLFIGTIQDKLIHCRAYPYEIVRTLSMFQQSDMLRMRNLLELTYVRMLTFIIVNDSDRELVLKVRLHHFLSNSIASFLMVDSMGFKQKLSQVRVNIALRDNMPVFLIHALSQSFNIEECIYAVIIDSLNIFFCCSLYRYLPLCRSCIEKSYVYVSLLHKSI